MLIDEEEIFNTVKDELIWTKIITICPLTRDNNKSTHLVKYYKTETKEEYYIFEYINADNNGLRVENFDEYHWSDINKQIDFPDYAYIYSRVGNNKDCFKFVTSGKIIKKYIQEYMNEQENKKYEEYKISSR